jgi:hypothetical protein
LGGHLLNALAEEEIEVSHKKKPEIIVEIEG